MDYSSNLKTKLRTFPWFSQVSQSKFEANRHSLRVMIGLLLYIYDIKECSSSRWILSIQKQFTVSNSLKKSYQISVNRSKSFKPFSKNFKGVYFSNFCTGKLENIDVSYGMQFVNQRVTQNYIIIPLNPTLFDFN